MTIRKYKDFEPNIDSTAYVDQNSIIIGDVTIGSESSIWPMTVARGDVQK